MSQESFNFMAQNHTPMMKQYLTIKSQYQDAILFYRMGDFYEMFFQDAIIAANCLGITLTKRGKHENQDIPMCGVPFHSSESYLHKLIEEGHKVAICEQVETPQEAKKRGHNAVVKREVVRLVTPGTIIEDNLLNAKSSNYLVCISYSIDQYALCWLDISTGEFSLTETSLSNLNSDLSMLQPKEIILADKLFNQEEIKKILIDWKRVSCSHVNSFFELEKCRRNILSFYNISSVEVIGNLSSAQIIALGAILEYVAITQKNNKPKLNFPKLSRNNIFMQIDHATRRNLELISSSYDNKKNTLLAILDHTATNMGGRLLFKYLSSPLIDPIIINKRLDVVECFFTQINIANALKEQLKHVTDLERAISRITLKYAGPRDLKLIYYGLFNIRKIAEILIHYSNNLPESVTRMINLFSLFDEIIGDLAIALNDELPLQARDGGFIQPTYHPKLLHLTELNNNGKNNIDILKKKYIQQTGISNLKIVHNNILGYFIEITPQHIGKIHGEEFIHRQTLASAVRYTTIELKKLEEDIVNAKDLILKIELEIFEQLCAKILEVSDNILLAAQQIATLDVFINFAELAKKNQYTRPTIDNSTAFEIQEGRHPVVETSLKKENNDFTPNNCNLSNSEHIWLLTGPNMAGKSTFLRQNAIIAIMAQIGCFVPAKYAHIGIVDRVFSRVGAADDLAKGRSTFMVEMLETAIILNQATDKSLIILDEIGRGTSTYDGLSIAWSCLEYIHKKINARTIFATHYHELASLEQNLKNVICYNVAVKEWENNIIFLHLVQKGAADKSYGIHVARIAGIPDEVTERANQLLEIFEKKVSLESHINKAIDTNIIDHKMVECQSILKQLNINNITPLEALTILTKLKNLTV